MATEIIQINTQTLESQAYNSQDTNLIPTFDVNTSLTSGSYIEYFVYDLNQNLLYTDYSFTQYTVLNDGQAAGNNVLSQIELDPERNLTSVGYDQGSYITYYNFLNKKIGSSLEQLYISEISSDRTEIRLDSTSLTNSDIVEQTTAFVDERENSEYFLDFYINFGDNLLYIANNIVLDNEDPNNPTILIKLYEPLPTEFNINSTLWVISSVEEPIAYQVNFLEEPIVFDDTIRIKGPNFNIELKDQVNNSTQELSYTDLIATSLTSSQNQLNSLLEEKEIDINIDYTNFEDFIHFSSAQTRLENFYHKVSLIEQYSSSIAILNNTNSSSLAVSQSTAVYEAQINQIITNFDGWDYYLYYSSGSWAWPKLNTEPPYQLAPTGSVAVLNWFGSTNEYSPQYGGIILSASLYDNNNKDNLLYSIPEYLREDPANAPYELFIDMVAQHFDNIWIYYKDVTNKFDADNRLESGISKDIVADAIRDFGVKLYQNNFSNQDLYTAFLGLTPEGGLFPFPNITGSLPTPSGFEYIDTLVSASNDYLPLDDVNKSLYKRIYHNLPYLLKSKGTLPGLRALITSYGIPDTILRINEYGGKDKVDTNDWDYWQNEFNFAYSTEENNFISSSWTLNSNWNSPNDVPSTLAFRFKTPELPTSNIRYSQSLWSNDSGSAITLTYTGSAYATGSYSGSIIDPYYQYATLEFYPDIANLTATASVYMPFFDGGWWSVMVNRSGSEFTLIAANKIYEGGNNGTTLGFYATSSITGNDIPWINSSTSYFPISFSAATVFGYDIVTYDNTAIYDGTGSLAGLYEPFSGSYQEIRYYTTVIHPDVFKDYVMNPYSIEGNSLNSAPNELAFRASIGGEFYTGSVSIHPKVTGSWAITQSFPTDSSFYYDLTPIFKPNTEYFFYDQPVAGIKNAVSDKIRLENDNIPLGNTLSPFRRLAQTTEASASYTPNINLLEVAFSPQDEINDDINSSIGFFNIGNFIGDPAFRSSRLTSYPDLDRLRNEYFEKYTKNYNLVDFIRLIKFFDNSLFKMIRDFVPARTSLASGVIIKQTLLERNRYPEPQTDNHTTIAKYGRSGSIIWNEPIIVQDITVTGSINPQWNNYNQGTVENFSGGTAGTLEQFNGINTSTYGNGPDNRFGITQSWDETYSTLSGSVTIVHDSQDEFYNGEFSGSVLIVTTQSLNQPYPSNYSSFGYKPVHYYGNSSLAQSWFFSNFINPITTPSPGEIYLFDTGTGINKVTTHIKIAKEDCNGNDNTNILENANEILIYNSIQGEYFSYRVILTGRGEDFFLFECKDPLQNFTTSSFPNRILDYEFSASKSTISSFTPLPQVVDNYDTVTGNTLGYFDSVQGLYTIDNTPNTTFSITASFTVVQQFAGSAGTCSIAVYNPSTPNEDNIFGFYYLNSFMFDSSFSGSQTISLGWNGLENDTFVFIIEGGFDAYLSDASFQIFQNRVPQNVSCSPITFFEPNITEANFYNSDENALINNVEDNRLSTRYLDVDYSTGILTPTNFNTILSGSAQKSPVQDSNYTLKRHINPRYNGSKTTSLKPNVWTSEDPGNIWDYDGDTNTYGKLSTVDSNKVYVAYCDNFSGWPPERMNSSAIKILYLIGEDGNVIIPGTSENSLSINKGTFESGERISISAQSNIKGLKDYYNIVRGGTRIEPILYTQSGSAPNAYWNNNIILKDVDPSNGGVTADYSAAYQYYFFPTNLLQLFQNSPQTIPYNSVISGPPISSGNSFSITQQAIDEGVDFTFTIYNLLIITPKNPNSPATVTFEILLYKNSVNPSNLVHYQTNNITREPFSPIGYYPWEVVKKVPNANLVAGDRYFVQIKATWNDPNVSVVNYINQSLKVSQFPVFPSPVSSSGYNTIWGWPDKVNYPYVITCSNSVLANPTLYGNPDVIQQDITGSGFNSINLPWSIKYGDEFRFEGRESWTYQVSKVFGPAEASGSDGFGRLFETGSIEVHFNADLPTSASQNVFNLNHFLIRRYVDDPDLILIEGLRPSGVSGDGPWLVKPEFVTPSLNKSIDQFIVDLTQKGLL